ncbi:MAG: hypothetical protein LBD88_05375 [Candidatus Peribacteria bacterium]|jgi:hypothetical protein|nr:hypothetical protein [Candidatus Peribacteria bacterium]
MRFLSEIETNILQKFLGNKLKTIPRSEDVYRISFDSTNTGNIIIIFTWE